MTRMNWETLVSRTISASCFHLRRPNVITLVSQNRQSAEETIHEMPARDTPATATCSDYPDFTEVALYPSSRVSSSPSVTDLDGAGTSRVFNVFQDDPVEE